MTARELIRELEELGEQDIPVRYPPGTGNLNEVMYVRVETDEDGEPTEVILE